MASSSKYIAMVFSGADRFSHLLYLGHEEVIAAIFDAKRLLKGINNHDEVIREA